MSTSGDVLITINDGSASSVVVPSASVQLVIGTSSAGTAAQIVATRSPSTLQSSLGYGLLPEAAALAIAAGGTVLAMKATSNTAGANTAVTMTRVGTSTCVVTVTGTPNDEYYVAFKVAKSGTIATTGILFQISLDAGRSYGPNIALGTATTYVIPNTGLTLNFAAGTLDLGDIARFSCTPPLWNTAGIQACLNAFQASQYAAVGIGSIHIVGVCSGADATTIQGYLDTLATGFIYNRCMLSVADVTKPTAWGGAGGQTEAQWITAIEADYAAVSAKRLLAAAGYYNMSSAYPNSAAGAPRYRRSLAWAQACRQVAIPFQRHSGRVRDGALSNIVVDAVNDPIDGFVYHDERINPGLDILTGGAGRFCSARTRVGLPGFYIVNPLLLSPLGSDFTIWPLGAVMDVACGIVHQVGQKFINADVRLNQTGTLFETEAKTIEQAILSALNDQMTAVAMISSARVVVDRTNNVQTTSKVLISVTIFARGYILEEVVSIALGNSLAA